MEVHGHRGQHTVSVHRAVQEAVYQRERVEPVAAVVNGDAEQAVTGARLRKERCPMDREGRARAEVEVASKILKEWKDCE